MNPSADAVIGDLGILKVTIQEDDSGVEFSAATYAAHEMDRNVEITVKRVGKIGFIGRGQVTFTVDYATADDTATAGQDYIAQSGTMRFGYFLNDWERTKTFTIPILDDGLVEGRETILLSLSNPSDGVVLGEQSTATVIIADNDTSTGPGRGANDSVQAILLLADGKAIIGGDFTFVDGTARNRIARLNSNTTLDSGFDPGSGANGTVYAVALQADGKVLLGGTFTNVNGVARHSIARLNSDGSVDPAFDPGAGAQGSSHSVQATVRAIAVQTNGQIVIGGYYSQYDGFSRLGIARLNANGSIDASFNPSYGPNAVFPIVLQPDGKILAAGYLKVSGYVVAFARLNADGSVDDTFQLGRDELGAAHVRGMALQMDGRILMNGNFIFKGSNQSFFGVLRFHTDGSIDHSFVSTNVIAGYINSFVLQLDERLIVGGRAARIAGVDPDGMVRVNPDGSLDATFDPKIDAQKDVFAVAVQPAGTMLIGGTFLRVNGLPRYRIAQLNADGSMISGVEFNPPVPMPEGHFRLTTKKPPPVNVIIEASSNMEDWIPIYTNTVPDSPLNFIDIGAIGFRQRFYRTVMKP
jgi:uncharacterized delta-60 repeat protein